MLKEATCSEFRSVIQPSISKVVRFHCRIMGKKGHWRATVAPKVPNSYLFSLRTELQLHSGSVGRPSFMGEGFSYFECKPGSEKEFPSVMAFSFSWWQAGKIIWWGYIVLLSYLFYLFHRVITGILLCNVDVHCSSRLGTTLGL